MICRTVSGVMALLALTAGLYAASPAAAQSRESGVRIAVIDLDRVFREYYKSKIAEDAIKLQAEQYRTQLSRQTGRIQQLKREAGESAQKAASMALNETERDRFAVEARTKLAEIQSLEAEVESFIKSRSRDMRQIEQGKREEIVAEIRREIDRRALAEGYDFVLDSSGKTQNDQPAVLRFPASDDISDQVIAELNRAKPSSGATVNQP